MLTKIDDMGHPCPDLRVKVFSMLTLNVMLAVFLYISFLLTITHCFKVVVCAHIYQPLIFSFP